MVAVRRLQSPSEKVTEAYYALEGAFVRFIILRDAQLYRDKHHPGMRITKVSFKEIREVIDEEALT